MLRTRLGIPLEAVAAVLGVVTAVTTVLASRPGHRPEALLISAAVLWGGAGVTGALLRHIGPTSQQLRQRSAEDPGFTTVVRLGNVPDEVARTSIDVAASAGPVVLLAIGREAPEGIPPAVTVVSDTDPDAAYRRALDSVQTDSVLLVSARAMPLADAVRRASTAITEGDLPGRDAAEQQSIGWVLGRTRVLNRDSFGVDSRERIDAVLRHDSAHHGLWLWEPDALVVKTELLQSHPPDIDRPLGSWLRDRVECGDAGVVVDNILTMRSAPVAAASYWPEAGARQRGQAADLADAAVHGRGLLSRIQAWLLLARLLSGWTAVLWAAALLLATDGLPLRMSTVGFGMLLASTIVFRWLALRVGTGVRPAPVRDLVSAAYWIPGSLGATGAALTRRVRRPRMAIPTRPLAWIALAATALAAYVLLATEPGASGTRAASVLALGLLASLWALNVRFLTEKDFSRTAFRVALDLPARLLGSPPNEDAANFVGRVVDGSPGGLAFLVSGSDLGAGDEVELEVELTDGSPVTVGATVASARRRHGQQLLGLQIRHLGAAEESQRWALELFDSARTHATAPRRAVKERLEPTRPAAVRWVDRALVGAVGVVTLVVLAALALVLLDLRPLVVRSGSMEPTYGVGDVLVVAETTAGQLGVGDVGTRFDSPEVADSLTHRVVALNREPGCVTVETRGDANDSSEIWTVPADTRVGLVEARVPLIGKPLTMVRGSAPLTAIALGTAALLVALILLLPRIRVRGPTRPESTSEGADRESEPESEVGSRARTG